MSASAVKADVADPVAAFCASADEAISNGNGAGLASGGTKR